MGLCDINEIKYILGKHGFHFSKSLGQNFLTDQSVPENIAAGCGADKNSCVLEVGPGMGCLTVELSKVADKVVSVEIDRSLLPVLDETLADCDNVEVVNGDVLKVDLKALCVEKFGDKKVHACANLPYYITSPAISTLIESNAFESITVMVQKEVAERICAQAGTKEYSAFSIYAKYYADTEIILDVPKDCFVPQPKVDSAVIHMKLRGNPPTQIDDEKLFFAMVRASFNQRRKTLSNSVSSAFGGRLDKQEIAKLIEDCGFDKNIRGEKLSLEEFAAMSNLAIKMINSKNV